MALPESFLQDLKMRNDIDSVISSYVNLKRRGRNLVGLCPFHSEKTPSFNVYTESSSFYCFGCGVGGDVISFIMKAENLDYMEAVKFLAQRSGLSLPENNFDDSSSKLRIRIYEANREAARFYHKMLYSQEGESALAYLRNRALKEQTIKHFGLGYSPDSPFALSNHLKKLGFSDSEIVAANLANYSKRGGIYDRFTDRVMFPIIDLRGNVIAFGGRVMSDKKPKYLNTSDTLVFKKSMNLFSLNNAKNSDNRTLILCEGYMDVIALNQAGFTNSIATLGTAIGDEQAIIIKRYADEVIICYDADEAGQKATARAINILRNAGINIRVISIPDGKDPDEFLRNNGNNAHAAFKNILDNSGNDVEYRLFKLKKSLNINTTEGKVTYLTEAAKLLATLDNNIEIDIYADKLSLEVGVEKTSVLSQVKKFSQKKNIESENKNFHKIQQEISGYQDKVNLQKNKNLRAANAEEGILAYLLIHQDKAEYISNRLPADKMITDFNRKLYKYFLDKIFSGFAPTVSVSADFTPEENGAIAKIISSTKAVATNLSALDEYISILLQEQDKLSDEQIKNASDSEIMAYLQKKKKNLK